MIDVNEIRRRRARAWEDAKKFLDSHRGENGLMSAEDEATYQRMEDEITAYGREIERMERANQRDAEMNALTSTPILGSPNAGTGNQGPRTSDAYKTGFWNHMRFRTAPTRDVMTEGTNADGGYLVPDGFEKTLIRVLTEANVMRRIATVIPMSGKQLDIPRLVSGTSAAWVAEGSDLSASDMQFDQASIIAHKCGVLTVASEELIQDSVFSIESLITEDFGNTLATVEEQAFVVGDGSGKPYGIMHATEGAVTGVTAASSTAIGADELMDLFHSVKSVYRAKAKWLMNDATVAHLRKLKDQQNQFIWQPGLKEGQPDMLLGRPIECSTAMPTIAASARPIAFGDFTYYRIGQRKGISLQRLNELYALGGKVGFLANMRVGGRLMLREAVKALAMKA